MTPPDGIWLYWLPLGAGGHLVRFNGLVYEAVAARLERRAPQPLLHSALEVRLAGERWMVEMTPVWGNTGADRGVVVEGPVGARTLGRSRLFRYEVRRWRGGTIGDVSEAVGGARTLSADAGVARVLLGLVPLVPAVTWGRDELRTGEMWNSNSLVSWLLARSGHDLTAVRAPGRAPGWRAGMVVAARSAAGRSERS
ncbi:MAG: hypothetical protein ABWX84_15515 [Nocardioides sp.]